MNQIEKHLLRDPQVWFAIFKSFLKLLFGAVLGVFIIALIRYWRGHEELFTIGADQIGASIAIFLCWLIDVNKTFKDAIGEYRPEVEPVGVDNPSNAPGNLTSTCTSDFTGRVSILNDRRKKNEYLP